MRAEAVNALGNRKRAQRALPGARVRDPLRVPGSQTMQVNLQPWLTPGDDLKRLRFTSALVIPMQGRETTEGMLFLGGSRDAVTFTLVPAILAVVGVIACWVPAMRATRVDPSVALRDE